MEPYWTAHDAALALVLLRCSGFELTHERLPDGRWRCCPASEGTATRVSSTARGWLGKAPKVVVSLDVTGRVLRRRTQQRASAFSVSRTDAGRDVVRDRGHRAGRPDVTCGGRAPETRESQPLGVMRDMPLSRRGCVTIERCPWFRPRERHGPERLEAKSENGGPRVARAR
jgi:hypothetical protein